MTMLPIKHVGNDGEGDEMFRNAVSHGASERYGSATLFCNFSSSVSNESVLRIRPNWPR